MPGPVSAAPRSPSPARPAVATPAPVTASGSGRRHRCRPAAQRRRGQGHRVVARRRHGRRDRDLRRRSGRLERQRHGLFYERHRRRRRRRPGPAARHAGGPGGGETLRELEPSRSATPARVTCCSPSARPAASHAAGDNAVLNDADWRCRRPHHARRCGRRWHGVRQHAQRRDADGARAPPACRCRATAQRPPGQRQERADRRPARDAAPRRPARVGDVSADGKAPRRWCVSRPGIDAGRRQPVVRGIASANGGSSASASGSPTPTQHDSDSHGEAGATPTGARRWGARIGSGRDRVVNLGTLAASAAPNVAATVPVGAACSGTTMPTR